MLKKLLLLAGAALCVSTAAHASIIPVLDSVTFDGTDYVYSYHATLSGDQGLVTGSQVVIYDFAGYVPGSIFAPSPFIVTSTPLSANFNTAAGGVQTNAVYTDDPTIPDLVFTYNGPDFRVTSPGLDITIPGLTAESTFGNITVDGFSSRAIKNSGLGTVGTVAFNNGAVSVPSGAVPEPASWSMLIMGFGGIGALLRLRRRQEPSLALHS
ncbi:PEPxxWA-CTERM sorting domain-containing protein [Phenylobacterium sp.]|jgi:hypothetical protein|uniref:PEPxxWA-CTERM sorting domain-containing protein n=1 Tax=Phenylobacterium sp. TaxID=1871053 RepID=UPI002E37DD26|nr:PEPxxWA-CTERM sorting domain-containing protein [Phenylobacterium sp.]HEX4711739.1 PEPxxWA-CTERM sorting domain-containing protein [Phenylobacterium sp.]